MESIDVGTQAIRQLLHRLGLELIHFRVGRVKLLRTLSEQLLKGPHFIALITEVFEISLDRSLHP